MTIEAVLRAPLPGRVDDVVERLRAIEEALPERDGVRAFTALYRAVTEAVDERVRSREPSRMPRFTRWLDVVFANLYLARPAQRTCSGRSRAAARVGGAVRGARASAASPPIQFALAGMNAHINRDLPLALVETCRRASTSRSTHGCAAARATSGAIDPLLGRDGGAGQGGASPRALVGWADEALGELDERRSRCGTSRRARAAAWVNAETLWAIRDVPFAGATLRRHARPARRPREPRPPPPRCLRPCASGGPGPPTPPRRRAVVKSVYDEYGFTWDEHGYHADLRRRRDGVRGVLRRGARRPDRRHGRALASTARWSGSTCCPTRAAPGAGSALLAAVADEARRRGHDRLEIWSDKRFEDAHRLYRREGARVVGERVHDDPDSSHEWGLVLDL